MTGCGFGRGMAISYGSRNSLSTKVPGRICWYFVGGSGHVVVRSWRLVVDCMASGWEVVWFANLSVVIYGLLLDGLCVFLCRLCVWCVMFNL